MDEQNLFNVDPADQAPKDESVTFSFAPAQPSKREALEALERSFQFGFKAHDDTDPDEFTPFVDQINRFAMVGVVVGAVAGLCFCVVCFFLVKRPISLRIIGVPVVWGLGGRAMGMGLSLLFAPDAFFLSLKGRKYMRAVGTSSIGSARIIIGIALFLGCLACCFFLYLSMKIVGIL